jgi:hypothetical protein
MMSAKLANGDCFDCAHWCPYEKSRIGLGECLVSEPGHHETIVKILVRRRQKGGIVYEPLEGPDAEDYHGVLVTPHDFSCASWVLLPEAGEG